MNKTYILIIFQAIVIINNLYPQNKNLISAEKEDLYFKEFCIFNNEIWSFDNIKRSAIEKLGFKVLTVWEYDYAQNKEKILQQCIDFLKK